MSSPTTPARISVRSMTSTPSTAEHGTSLQQLTPRSKVKAMLAAIDDESDSEPVKKAGRLSRPVLSAVTGNAQKLDVEKEFGRDIDSSEEAESIHDSPAKPRGKLAARLTCQLSDNEESTSSNANGENGDGGAYTRIKKLLRTDAKRAYRPLSDSESDVAVSRKLTTQPNTPNSSETPQIALDYSPPRKAAVTSSPGLFVTPESTMGRHRSPARETIDESSDSDLLPKPQANRLHLELVAREGAEGEAIHAEETCGRKKKTVRRPSVERELSQNATSASGLSDEELAADRRLTQLSRPTRKASKKALEEMNRETQRMSRNMQLAHQAKTKKKITKDSLFARFNFRIPAVSNGVIDQHMSSSTAASSAPATDAEDRSRQGSPPTSPIGPEDVPKIAVDAAAHQQSVACVAAMPMGPEDDELPSMLEMMSQPAAKVDKGKGKAIEDTETKPASDLKKSRDYHFTQRPIKIHPPKPSLQYSSFNLESDSDLEVMPSRKKKHSRSDIFDRLPASKVQQGRSLQTLRALAHLNSPEKQHNGRRSSMSLADLQKSLQGRARQQAVAERAAKIEDLKSRGIIVQSAEERQKDQAEVEDLLEKARKEGEEIHQKEKRAAKKAKIANGEANDLPNTSDEDDEYQEDENDVEFSGSEEAYAGELNVDDEDASNDEDSGDGDKQGEIALEDEEPERGHFVEDEASEDGDDEKEQDRLDDDDNGEDDDEADEPKIQRFRRNKMVIAEDDDDDDEHLDVDPDAKARSQTPAAVFPTVPPIFGDSKNMVVPMGMTQAFAATMAHTQTQFHADDEEQDSLALFGPAPEPDIRMFDIDDMVEDSQNGAQFNETNKDIDLHFSQSQIRYDALGDTQGDTQGDLRDLAVATQMSEIPDPTQDVGFIMSSTAPQRFASPPPSTVDTVLVSGGVGNNSPYRKKRGRLQRRVVIEEEVSDPDIVPATIEDEAITPVNAFDIMEKSRKKAAATAAKEAFNRKKSEAKGMVEEQAQESEDEFQGIGGPSDDESGGEDDEYIREMIDQGEVEVNERQLAALHADRERASDEKAVEKLYKDINSGMLRRKRGAEFDLSDSDDDAEARQRRKRREFAKMRKALLENENVGKIAEDPKKLAFLRAIEDREVDDDLDFLDRPAEDSFRVETGTQEEPGSQSQQLPAAADANDSKRRRPLEDSQPDNANMRPPPAARRTLTAKKPASLAEIRESVSFLIEEPGTFNVGPDPSSSASEDENTHIEQHRNPRRTSPKNIVDRLSLKRTESASTSSTTRFAFHNSSATDSGFKVPSLLRRATTTQLHTNVADANGISTAAATERAAGGGEKGDFVRRGGTKRSSINFYSREKERKVVVEQVEKRRKDAREKEARMRRSGLIEMGVNAFE